MTENLEPLATESEVTDKLIICINGEDWILPYDDFGITFNSTETEIMEAIRPAIQEQFDVDIKDEESGWLYKTRKATNTHNVYIVPNSTAG